MYAEAEMFDRYHVPGSTECWILVKSEDPTSHYQHALKWDEFLDWETIQYLHMKKLATFAQKPRLDQNLISRIRKIHSISIIGA